MFSDYGTIRIVSKLSVRSIRGNILLLLDSSASTFENTYIMKKVIVFIVLYNASSIIAILTYFKCVTSMNTKRLRRVFSI